MTALGTRQMFTQSLRPEAASRTWARLAADSRPSHGLAWSQIKRLTIREAIAAHTDAGDGDDDRGWLNPLKASAQRKALAEGAC